MLISQRLKARTFELTQKGLTRKHCPYAFEGCNPISSLEKPKVFQVNEGPLV